MADSAAFELACGVLENGTSLARLEARGTVRLALKAAGLDPRTVTPHQMGAVVDNLLAGELKARGVADGASVCAALKQQLARIESTQGPETPEAVFARLARS
jgi:hypothetical protein